MIGELDTVALTHDIPEYNLKQGDIGAVVHCYKNSNAFEVEFVTADGNTVALLMLNHTDIRNIRGKEVMHVRELTQVAV
jgi:hypothetical protein